MSRLFGASGELHLDLLPNKPSKLDESDTGLGELLLDRTSRPSFDGEDSLESTGLFVPDLFDAHDEISSAFDLCSATSDASSRLPSLVVSSFATTPVPSLPQAVPAAQAGAGLAPASSVPAHPSMLLRLNLRLDYQAVMRAWSAPGTRAHPFALPPLVTAQLAAHLPAAADCSLLLSAARAAYDLGAAADLGVEPPAEAPTAVLLAAVVGDACAAASPAARVAALARYKEKKGQRAAAGDQVVPGGSGGKRARVRYEARKVTADKRPRYKGRFVKKAEQDALTALRVPDAEPCNSGDSNVLLC